MRTRRRRCAASAVEVDLDVRFRVCVSFARDAYAPRTSAPSLASPLSMHAGGAAGVAAGVARPRSKPPPCRRRRR